MHRSKRIEKPDWFELDRYDSLNQFDFKKWAYQLFLRFDINYDINHECDYCGDLCKEKAKEKFVRIKENPLPDCPEDFNFEPPSSYCDKHKIPGLKFLTPLVRSTARYAPLTLPIESEKDDYQGTNYEELDYIFDAQLSDLGKTNGTVFLSVNLNASDKVLMNEFRAYLAHVRNFYNLKEADIKPRSILKRLTDNKVLQFLDLWIYSQLENTSLNEELTKDQDFLWRTYGDWLFPFDRDEVGDGDTARKTIKPFALDAIKLHFIISLANTPEEKS